MELKKAAFIMIHGQGTNKKHSHEELFSNLKDELDFPDEILFHPIKYYSEIQKNQNALMRRMPEFKCFPKIREKLISSFGDSATIKSEPKIYDDVMSTIKESLISVRSKIEPFAPIFILGHSLGSVLLSNFLWDMQKAGVYDKQIQGIFTTGNPSYIFLSGVKNIRPIEKISSFFFWVNFWNQKDLLSSPLAPLSYAYSEIVTDIRVKKGWPIFAHGKYDGDKHVYKVIAKKIGEFL